MTPNLRVVTLDDKYLSEEGSVLLTGIQALVRLTLEQRRLDERRGLDTRVYVSGYQGSPLGTVDSEMGRARRHLEAAGVVFQAGLNEELAATAVAGTQLVRQTRSPRHQGVTGFWFGKNPGLDRAADAIRHGNVSGTSAHGGAVAWIGDDPASKSSTVPSASEQMCQSLGMPLLAPSSVVEILHLGLHAVAMSRASGLWTGLKIVADIADASETVVVDDLGDDVPPTTRSDTAAPPVLVGPSSLEAEHDLLTRRLALARQYARNTRLNRIDLEPSQVLSGARARLAIVASGMAYAALRRALANLAIDDQVLARMGVRLVKLRMPYPSDGEHLRMLLDGVERVLVVEDKTDFIENQVRSALYGISSPPDVIGRRDTSGAPLLTSRGALGAEEIARALEQILNSETIPQAGQRHLEALSGHGTRRRLSLPLVPSRTPYFCSGCPHNISTRATPDTLVGVGIGCHSMVVFDRDRRGQHIGPTQMGGEGAQWFGMQPFTDDRHFVQNLGDGTFHHSGSLAIRAAVAAGARMTYKLLYNDAVAMTGGQRAEGRMDVATLTRSLALEGVRKIVVTTDDPRKYRRTRLDRIATVRHRDDIPQIEKQLAEVDGVTVLVHDDRCAAEERRLRKRGKLETPARRVAINERVCEGCGDCGDKSSCLSVLPVETALGRKTQIHPASCNSDFSCLQGDCPSFLLVEPTDRRKTTKDQATSRFRKLRRSYQAPVEERSTPPLPVSLVPPVALVPDTEVLLRMPGIGGTGVVTVSAILQMAAHLDGRFAAGLEQVGLAQKGGPVVSDVRISRQPIVGALRASKATADVFVALDVLGAAADTNLEVCTQERTVPIVNTAVVPTAAMVTGRAGLPDSADAALGRIASATRAEDGLFFDASYVAERLFGDNMATNMIMLGAVYQHGCLPISDQAIMEAIRLNGAAVEQNRSAFEWGRALAMDAQAVMDALAAPLPDAITTTLTARQLVEAAKLPDSVKDVAARLASDLEAYQNHAYASLYVGRVTRVAQRLADVRSPEVDAVSVLTAYAGGLYKLMAYKDEYEVARLHLDQREQARVSAEFGPGASVSVMLHPPVLRALGMKRKIRLRRSATPVFAVLRSARRLRSTPLDLFGYAEVRRTERALINEYVDSMDRALDFAANRTARGQLLVELAELPDLVRGYEHIKMANVEQFRQGLVSVLSRLENGEMEKSFATA